MRNKKARNFFNFYFWREASLRYFRRFASGDIFLVFFRSSELPIFLFFLLSSVYYFISKSLLIFRIKGRLGSELTSSSKRSKSNLKFSRDRTRVRSLSEKRFSDWFKNSTFTRKSGAIFVARGALNVDLRNIYEYFWTFEKWPIVSFWQFQVKFSFSILKFSLSVNFQAWEKGLSVASFSL